MEVLSRSQTDVEKVKLEMEMEMRDIKYRLDNEIQSRIMAEGLVSQLKEQLKRGDDKLAGYKFVLFFIHQMHYTL